MAAEVNGHVLTEAGEGHFGSKLYRCVECGRKATSRSAFEKMDECDGETV